MKILIKYLSLSLFAISFAVVASASSKDEAASDESWIVEELRDDFDDRLLSISTLAKDARGNGGWLSATCQLEKKIFTLNIVSTEYGRRLENIESQKDNLKYVIDDGKPKIITTTQIVQGTAISNNLSSRIVKDIMAGGKVVKIKFLGDTGAGPVVRFDIAGAASAMKKIVKSCR